MQDFVSREVAEADINKWLDANKVRKSVRVKYADTINVMIEAVEDGMLLVLSDCSLQHVLMFPIETEDGNIVCRDLAYKLRFKVADLSAQLNQLNASNPVEVTQAYVCALTGQAKAIIGKMDIRDYKLAQCVASFFM